MCGGYVTSTFRWTEFDEKKGQWNRFNLSSDISWRSGHYIAFLFQRSTWWTHRTFWVTRISAPFLAAPAFSIWDQFAYDAKVTFDSYLYKTVQGNDPMGDLKLGWKTLSSLYKFNNQKTPDPMRTLAWGPFRPWNLESVPPFVQLSSCKVCKRGSEGIQNTMAWSQGLAMLFHWPDPNIATKPVGPS